MNEELAIPVVTSELICGEIEAQCRCVLAPHEDGAHRCACGGSWEINADGTFVIHSHPGSSDDWDGPGPDDYMPIVNLIFGSWLS
jgi:hypothetical protein